MNEFDSNISVTQLYEEIIKSREDLNNAIQASETTVIPKVESLNRKVIKLEEENQELRARIELLERNSKNNNIDIFGLEISSRESLVELVFQELKRTLCIDITEIDINNIYPLGNSANSPIKIEFVSELKKEIHTKKLQQIKRHKYKYNT
ncbi:hypothetical protein NQ314_009856 [Rhamnusium bicolor]|uniref:Uncharacterized protein n=1 Tax=Rhamnusium bicolor TaxID=1586634 RepID=A0AAV8XWS6_9CUCU|nr:hypothetical protein NQ314_009856 [Rhamnusium bicolor]